ncbi:Clp protease N-terminal domain-containing protein [Kutzneria chonburiensis]|uniref:Clp protease N-terminal domain-containing protein n=2 Tax=Kutzneria chonburiensis TaxID=1483604 RepID=A0ABV6MI68_9PSEU
MFEKFTDPAKRVLVLAQDEAMAQGHDYIGTEHVLVGLADMPGTIAGSVLRDSGVTVKALRAEIADVLVASGVQPVGAQGATEALAAIGIDVEEIRRRADETFGPGKFHFPRPPFTPRAKKALEHTLRQMAELHSDTIGPEHLLLGILAEAERPDEDRDGGSGAAVEGVGVKVLRNLGIDVDALRPAVLARMTG